MDEILASTDTVKNRIPDETWEVTGLFGVDFPEYRVGPLCSAPGCHKYADHVHFIIRRSFLGGVFDWVRMPDGKKFAQKTALCFYHHDLVTVNTTRIGYEDGVFYYGDEGPLDPQPMEHGSEEVSAGHTLVEGHDGKTCPTCKRKLPKPKFEGPMEEKKPRVTWAISIPVSAQENGYEVLDELLEGCREKLDDAGISYSGDPKVRYHVLCTTLGIFLQNAELILADA